MAEEIKTILTADSSELSAEFAKASAIAQKYAADRESQGNRALASARAEVEALRLEATGHGAAAAALREKMQLTEQARQLAAKSGVTEENATQILARQLELKKQMVTAAAAVAAAEQRAARISAPGSHGVALPEVALTAANLQAMEKMQFRANELRKTLNNPGAKTGNAMGLLAVSAAVEDAQYGFKGVINNIPQAVMAFGNFTPAAMRLAGGLSLVAVAGYAAWKAGYALGADKSFLEWAETQTEALAAAKKALVSYQDATRQRRDQDATGRRINEERERGNRLIERELQLDDDVLQGIEKQRAAIERKRAAEDAVLSAAGGSGEFSGGRVDSAKRNLEARRSVEDAAAAQQRLNDLGRDWERTWKETGTIAGDFAAKSRAASREFEQATDSLGMLKSKQVELEGYLSGKGLGPKDTNRTKSDLADIRKLIAEREKLISEKQADIAFNDDEAKRSATQGKAKLEQLRKLQDAERDRLAQIPEQIRLREQLHQIEAATYARAARNWQAELAIQQALSSNDVERARALERQRDIEAEKLRIMQDQKGISEAEAGKKAAQMVDTRADAGAAAAKKAAAEELAILRARAAGQNNRAGHLRAVANLERQILEIMRSQNLTREQASKQAKELAEIERNKARGDVIAELKALKMEAGGNKKGADRLREEMRIREESIALAQRLGISERAAQSLLREKARLEKEIADRKKNTGDDEHRRTRARGVRRFANSANDMSSGNNMRDWGWNMGPDAPRVGLRNHEVSRRSTERSHRPAKPSDDPAKNLLKSVNIQEQMLKIWQKLNVV